MTDFGFIHAIYVRNSRLTSAVIDNFLIYYAASQDRLDKAVDTQLARFRHISGKMPKSWENSLKSQVIAHRIFKEDGLLRKYLRHSALKKLNQEQMNFLVEQLRYPWRFSFSRIVDKPEQNFFVMEDVLSGENFLLYSPGVMDINQSANPLLWFNLIAFNGACWQTFGPIAYFKGFEPDDIYFFATEMNPRLESEADIIKDIEQNPLPYAMLFSGGELPLIFHRDDQMILQTAEYHVDQFDAGLYTPFFHLDNKETVHRLALKEWNGHPHFALGYYDTAKKILLLTAATNVGFETLAKTFSHLGFPVDTDPHIRVNLSMMATAGDVLKKTIMPDVYAHHFKESPDEEKSVLLDKLNKALALALPDINAGIKPDIEKIARQTGTDPRTVEELLNNSMRQIRKMLKNRPF